MKTPSADLILLKGAPGVGKSTTAKLLARHFPSGVRIEVDALRQMVTFVDWTNQAEHRNLLKLSAKLAAGFIHSGQSPVILVDTFSGDKIDGFFATFREESPQSSVFVAVLHASDEVLRQRMTDREGETFRDISIATRINHDSVAGAQPFETLIDTTSLAPTRVADAILAAIQAERVDEVGDEPPLPLQTSPCTPREHQHRLGLSPPDSPAMPICSAMPRSDPFPKLLNDVLVRLTGRGCGSYFRIIDISEDGKVLRFPGTNTHPREDSILPTSRELALQLRSKLAELTSQGADLSRVVVNIDGDGNLVITSGGRQQKAQSDTRDKVVCDLRHGVVLTIRATSERLGIREVAEFLSEAMQHFKLHRDTPKTGRYIDEPYSVTVKDGEHPIGTLQLSCPIEEGVPAALWTDAVSDAYADANTVEQMLDDLSLWRQTVGAGNDHLREVLALLDKPRGDLLALAAMLEHSRKVK